MTTTRSRAVRRRLQGLVVALPAFLYPTHAVGQPLPTASISVSDRAAVTDSYAPITPKQRLDWSADGVFGRPAVLAAVAGDVWQSAWNTPPEWGRTWRGAGFRFAEREVDVALSNGIEAGLGSLWSEDPRYIRLGHGGIARRFGYAARTVFVAPRKDGAMAPAWARYAGNTVNNVIRECVAAVEPAHVASDSDPKRQQHVWPPGRESVGRIQPRPGSVVVASDA